MNEGMGGAPAVTAPFEPRLVDLVLSLVLTLVFFAVPVVLYGAIVGRMPLFGGGQPSQGEVVFAVALEAAAIIGAIYLAVLRRRRIGWRAFGLHPVSREWLLGSASVGLGCVILLAVILILVQVALDRPLGNPQVGVLAPEGFSWIGLFLLLPLGGVAVPVAEELAFRGLFYPWLRRRLSIAVSAVVSALLFGLVHGQLEVIAGGFVVGIILALSYERSGSLWPPIVIHAVQNSVAIALMFLMPMR